MRKVKAVIQADPYETIFAGIAFSHKTDRDLVISCCCCGTTHRIQIKVKAKGKVVLAFWDEPKHTKKARKARGLPSDTTDRIKRMMKQ